MIILLFSLLLTLSPHRTAALCEQLVQQTAVIDSLDATRRLIVPYAATIDAAAVRYELPAALLAAVVQEESRFDPWATRVERGYLRNPRVLSAARRWIHSHRGQPNLITERSDRSRSFGLMQVMGEVAREQGYAGQYLARLYLPQESIDQGARLLKRLLLRYRGDTLSAISAYNQGLPRKRRGVFANARYVFRVATAWKFYTPLFTPQ